MTSRPQHLVFPSLEWFDALRAEVNERSVLKKFGPFDLTLGIRADDLGFILRFANERCTSIEEANPSEIPGTDFWLEQSARQWRAMLEDIKKHGRAEGEYTLSSLDLKRREGLVQSSDIYKRDLFYRFNQSLQDFFDASHALNTAFREPAGA
jgi:hypothetical protein